MVMDPGRINPPPPPSTPENAPWEDLRRLTQRLDRLIDLIEAPRVPGVPGVPGAPVTIEALITIMQELIPESIGNSAVITFVKEIDTAYQDEQDRQIPFTGVVRDVVMGFPAGCQQLLEVRLIYYPTGGGRKYIVPTVEDSFVALDDFTVVFQPRFSIKKPGNLRVEWWNYDSLNTHTVPVIATVVPTRLEIEE